MYSGSRLWSFLVGYLRCCVYFYYFSMLSAGYWLWVKYTATDDVAACRIDFVSFHFVLVVVKCLLFLIVVLCIFFLFLLKNI